MASGGVNPSMPLSYFAIFKKVSLLKIATDRFFA